MAKKRAPIADERQQLIMKSEISINGGRTWQPCLRFQDHPTVRAGKPWMHRITLGEALD